MNGPAMLRILLILTLAGFFSEAFAQGGSKRMDNRPNTTTGGSASGSGWVPVRPPTSAPLLRTPVAPLIPITREARNIRAARSTLITREARNTNDDRVNYR